MSRMLLPVLLTEAEKVLVLGDLSQKLTALEQAKAAKKAASADHNETIKNLEGSIHGLNQSIISGTVDREVEVERRPIPFAGKVGIYRMDRDPAGELVREEHMDDDERQLRLGDTALPGGKVTNLADHQRTEEQAVAGSPEEAEEIRAQRLAAEREERVAALAAELTDNAHVIEVPREGLPPLFAGTITHGEGDATVLYEQQRDTAEEARAAVARHAAQAITAAQEEAEAKARAEATPPPAAANDPIERIMAELSARVVIEERPGGMLLARIDGAIEGLPGRQGFSGPIRATAQETIDETLAGVRQLLKDNRTWVEAIETSKKNEVARLAGEQHADDAATKKRLLKVPKGAKSKRLKVTDEAGAVLAEGGAADELPAPGPAPEVDTTPGPGEAF